MSINIITIDVDPERTDEPIKVSKPQEMYGEGTLDDILKKDINDITITSLYLASMLSEEDEMKTLEIMEKMIKARKNEITGEN